MTRTTTVKCFTSIALNYLAKARVLGLTLKRHHPDWHLTVCISDREPEGFSIELEDEPFDAVTWAHQLPLANLPGWFFKHDVVELCTAVKGPMLEMLVDSNGGKVFYLDPDIAVLGSLDPLVELLDEHPILFTPHQLEPESELMAVMDNEICSLSHGAYNLGFLAVRGGDDGLRFVRWWSDRLQQYCYDDTYIGLFVDQKWCDLAPALFDGLKIIRDPGCNVASWNLSNRKVEIHRDGSILVNGSPLRFFHFTKLGPIGDVMTQRYAKNNVDVYELWSWYKRFVADQEESRIPDGWWHYGRFSNGEQIPKNARIVYRQRVDLQEAFPDPFVVQKRGDCYYTWLRNEALL